MPVETLERKNFGRHYLNFISIADTNHDWTNGRASQKGEPCYLHTYFGLIIFLSIVKLIFKVNYCPNMFYNWNLNIHYGSVFINLLNFDIFQPSCRSAILETWISNLDSRFYNVAPNNLGVDVHHFSAG